jgi:hypothetical protein
MARMATREAAAKAPVASQLGARSSLVYQRLRLILAAD